MNLSTLAYTIGQRIGLVQDNDIKACKAFLQVRYDQLWRSFLWRDSLIEYVTPIDPSATYLPTSNYLPTKGHLILPAIFGQVIACRTNANSMNVQRPMLYYRMSQDEFTKGGSPLEFYLLSAAVWELDFSVALMIENEVTEAGIPVVVDTLQADGVSVNRATVQTSGNVLLPPYAQTLIAPTLTEATTDRVDTFSKPATQNPVMLTTLNFPQLTVTNTSTSPATFVATYLNGTQITFTLAAGQSQTLNAPAGQPLGAYGAFLTSLGYNGIGGYGTYSYGQFLTGQFTYTGVPDPQTEMPYTQAASYIIISTLAGTDTFAPKCQRIRFMSIPNGAVIVRVLGKRITPPFSADSDSPVINGMDGVLFGLGYYDMCARKNAQGTPEAQAALIEAVGPNFLNKGVAGGFLGKLIEEEVIQAASNTRIIPEGGFGDTGGNFGSWATKASPY
jgi:hypothetical protein